MSRVSTTILALFLCALVSTPLMAQTVATQDLIQSEKATPATANNGISGFASDLLHDQKGIWTSPLHINRGDFEWLAPTAAGGAALAVFDHRISNSLKPDTSLRTPSNMVSNIGEVAPWAIPGTMWLLGAKTHNEHTLEAGRLGLEAALDSEVVMNVIKLATHRMRPNGQDNLSFPSGHTMSAFALAAVMSREYHNKPLVVFGSYGFATAVGLARVGGLNHFPTDVLAGAVLGELVGEYVVHHHARLAEQ
jgi:membrane-associated phospholipid phosphatase